MTQFDSNWVCYIFRNISIVLSWRKWDGGCGLSSSSIQKGESLDVETTSSGELREFVKNKGNNVYKGDANFRLQDKIELNKKINTLNRQQRKIFDEMMDMSEENFFFYICMEKLVQEKCIF